MNTKIKTYKFKLKLNTTQKLLVEEYLSTSRLIWNLSLETRNYSYSKGRSLNYYDLSSQLTQLRKEFDWIRKLPSNTCQDILERQEKAFKKYFDQLKNGTIAKLKDQYISKKASSGFPININKLKSLGKPSFKKKGYYNSVTFKNVKQLESNKIKLEKFGIVKFFNSREIEGQIRICIIKKEIDGYYLIVCSKIEVKEKHLDIDNTCSIDMGIKNLVTTSDGQYFENPKALQNLSKRLRVEQRSLNRKQKGSKSREKAKVKLAKTYLKIKRVRQDNLHKVSTEIANQYNYVVIEDLSIDKMVKNKSFAKGVYDASWGKFFELLSYKTNVIRVNPAYTSQTCSKCGHISKENRKTQSEFKCVSCGFEENADFNACQEILKRGRAALGIANVDH